MKAIALDLRDDKPIVEMRDMPVPEIAPDEVLIRVKAASICGTDIAIANYIPAMRERIKKLPHILGHEFAGNIVELGKNVNPRWKIGNCVSAETHIYCGECSVCRHNLNLKHVCPNLKLLGVDRSGCFAEYIAVPEKVLWENDANLPVWLASIQEPLGNSVYSFSDCGDIRRKNILIIGDGPAGLFAAAVAKIFGTEEVVIIGHHESRLAIAEKVGADITINTEIISIDFIKDIFEVKFPAGFDVVLEYSGSEKGISDAINYCRPGGRLVVFGITKNPLVEIPYNLISKKILNIRGIYGRVIWNTWEEVSWILQEYSDVIESIITHKLPFNEWQRGFDLMMNQKTCGKVVLLMEE